MSEGERQLDFFHVHPGELWGNEEYDWKLQKSVGRADALWIVADTSHPHNGNQDRIIVHWFEKETETLFLFKRIEEDAWFMHGYEDGEFGLFDENYGIFYKRSLIDYLFSMAKKLVVGKTI